MISRQRRYQAQHRVLGLCIWCPRRAVGGGQACRLHLLKNREATRKRQKSKPWVAGKPGRPPIYLKGR